MSVYLSVCLSICLYRYLSISLPVTLMHPTKAAGWNQMSVGPLAGTSRAQVRLHWTVPMGSGIWNLQSKLALQIADQLTRMAQQCNLMPSLCILYTISIKISLKYGHKDATIFSLFTEGMQCMHSHRVVCLTMLVYDKNQKISMHYGI